MFKCRHLVQSHLTAAATSSSTVTLRKNSVNASNISSINANTTGAFSDTTSDNDSIATGDVIAVKVVSGTSALIIDIIACTFASPSSNTVTRVGCMEVPNAPSGPATWFMPGAGIDANSGSFITSETSGVKLLHRKAMTIKNLAAYFFNSGDLDTVTVHSRKNGANGNPTCSIASQSNALSEDTSNSDSIAVGDDYDFSFAGQGNGARVQVI